MKRNDLLSWRLNVLNNSDLLSLKQSVSKPNALRKNIKPNLRPRSKLSWKPRKSAFVKRSLRKIARRNLSAKGLNLKR